MSKEDKEFEGKSVRVRGSGSGLDWRWGVSVEWRAVRDFQTYCPGICNSGRSLREDWLVNFKLLIINRAVWHLDGLAGFSADF
ncbi:MAG: hypothetical protein EOP49_38725 [Sphingobacteriales bacterium]|nr:MAG: hypothetical protein EOP49_38725 [Sphingobacteriales bacterium]